MRLDGRRGRERRWSPGERWELLVQLGAHPVVYPLIRGLGRWRPVLRIPGAGVLVSDPALLRQSLMDPSNTKDGPRSSAALWTPVVGEKALLNMEGAEHRELRRRLQPVFSPAAVRGLVADAAGRHRARVRSGLAEGGLDLVGEVKELAGGVIARLLGLDVEDPGRPGERELFDIGSSVTGFVRLGRSTLRPREIATARAAVALLSGPAGEAYDEGSTATFPGRLRSLGLSRDEAMGTVSALVLTGTETLVSYIPRLVALLADGERLPALAADDSLREGLVAEALRFTVPSPMMLRTAGRDHELGGVQVRAGDRLMLSTVSAAKGLGGFDPARSVPAAARQLWFGAGPHFCIGMPLAMAEIDAVLDVLLEEYRVAPWRVSRRAVARGVLIPRYERLELTR